MVGPTSASLASSKQRDLRCSIKQAPTNSGAAESLSPCMCQMQCVHSLSDCRRSLSCLHDFVSSREGSFRLRIRQSFIATCQGSKERATSLVVHSGFWLSCLGRTPVAVSRVCMYPSGQFQSEPSGSLRVTASCALRSMVDRIDLSQLKARCLLCNLWTSFHKPKLQQSISQARQLGISIFRPRMLSFSPLTCA